MSFYSFNLRWYRLAGILSHFSHRGILRKSCLPPSTLVIGLDSVVKNVEELKKGKVLNHSA